MSSHQCLLDVYQAEIEHKSIDLTPHKVMPTDTIHLIGGDPTQQLTGLL